ncbi:hypothetical protein Lal_00023177 [Lupinus albus]|nr:hypothetical protein Lal_00023177 [Lupinus albus]
MSAYLTPDELPAPVFLPNYQFPNTMISLSLYRIANYLKVISTRAHFVNRICCLVYIRYRCGGNSDSVVQEEVTKPHYPKHHKQLQDKPQVQQIQMEESSFHLLDLPLNHDSES